LWEQGVVGAPAANQDKPAPTRQRIPE
jgi:hypothetical protein